MKRLILLLFPLFALFSAMAQTAGLTLTTPQDSTTVVHDIPKPELKKYSVGDYYNDGVKEGVVFEVSEDGMHGKILNLKQSYSEVDWASDESEQRRFVGATNPIDGRENMRVIQSIEGWKEKYPLFAWCAELGEGWYVPAIEELKVFTLNDAVHNIVNQTLATHEGMRLFDKKEMGWYWSSTEDNKSENGIFCAKMVRMYLCGIFSDSKRNINYACAIAVF